MPNNNIRPELNATVFGLQARFFGVVQNTDTGRILNQTISIHGRQITGYDKGAMLSVELRFDDSCKNGHESFSITGEVRIPNRGVVACGCLHEDIARVFPELEPIIKWHLTSTDGPMHYVTNTCYHAGDRDSNGKRKGEPRDLNAARSTAVWPDATDDELCQERLQLEAALRGRLPALLAEFKRDMLKIGFIYPEEPDAPPTR